VVYVVLLLVVHTSYLVSCIMLLSEERKVNIIPSILLLAINK